MHVPPIPTEHDIWQKRGAGQDDTLRENYGRFPISDGAAFYSAPKFINTGAPAPDGVDPVASLDDYVADSDLVGLPCLWEPVRSLIAAHREREAQLIGALTWALGANGDFPERRALQGNWYWRTELAERAGLKWDGTKYVTALIESEKGRDHAE